MSSRPIDPYVATDEALVEALGDQPRYRVRQVRDWLARGVDDPREMTDLPKPLRERLAERLVDPPSVVRHSTADDGLTHKILLGMPRDGRVEAVESVLMLYSSGRATQGAAGDPDDVATGAVRARATVCVSSQAGCAMGCPFCATGQAGYRGQLSAGEIVRQVTVMQRLLSRRGLTDTRAPAEMPSEDAGTGVPSAGIPDHVTNVVFMGMGEPLANAGPVLDAVQWLADGETGFGLSARSITVSTVGLVPGMRKLTALGLPVTLAVSLHAPNDALRDDLVPPNRQFPLDEVLDAAQAHADATGRRLTFEYVLIDGLNDERSHARELAALVRGMPAHVNLIPMNPTPAVPWDAPPVARQRAFREILAGAGVPATIRHNRGGEIDAACGQLYASYAAGTGATLPAAVGAADRIAALSADPGTPSTGRAR